MLRRIPVLLWLAASMVAPLALQAAELGFGAAPFADYTGDVEIVTNQSRAKLQPVGIPFELFGIMEYLRLGYLHYEGLAHDTVAGTTGDATILTMTDAVIAAFPFSLQAPHDVTITSALGVAFIQSRAVFLGEIQQGNTFTFGLDSLAQKDSVVPGAYLTVGAQKAFGNFFLGAEATYISAQTKYKSNTPFVADKSVDLGALFGFIVAGTKFE